jgi:hypothetical protein
MKLEASAEIAFPRERVFETYRDKLTELVPFLPNVRGIEVTSRAEDGHVVKMVNRWKGGGDIPAAARQVIGDKLLEWDDYATWDAASLNCHWKTVVPAFKEALHAEGTNRFEDLGGGRTRLIISGDIEIDGARLPKVPKFIGKAVAPAVETFLVATIKPNLIAVSKGVERYLQERR